MLMVGFIIALDVAMQDAFIDSVLIHRNVLFLLLRLVCILALQWNRVAKGAFYSLITSNKEHNGFVFVKFNRSLF